MARYVPEIEELLTPGEVCRMFRIDRQTLNRWARAGKVSSLKTLGGHKRFPAAEVRELLNGSRRDRGE